MEEMIISTTTEYQQVKGKRDRIEKIVDFVLPWHFVDMKNAWWNIKMMNTDDEDPNHFTFWLGKKEVGARNHDYMLWKLRYFPR